MVQHLWLLCVLELPMVDCGIPLVAWGKQFCAFLRERLHGMQMAEPPT